jgi:hypothetical protein
VTHRLLRSLVPAAILAGLGVVACTTPTGTAGLPITRRDAGKRDSGAGPEKARNPGPKDGPEAKPDAGKPAPPGAGAACGKEPGSDACRSCCDAAFPSVDMIWKRSWDECTCAGSCKSACATSICAANPVDAVESDSRCFDCLDRESTSCADRAMSACLADPACGGFDACMNTCPDDGLGPDEETLPAPAPERN